MQVAGLTQALAVEERIRMLALVGLLGFALFVVAIEAHSFSNLGLILVWTSKHIHCFFPLIFFLFFQHVSDVLEG